MSIFSVRSDALQTSRHVRDVPVGLIEGVRLEDIAAAEALRRGWSRVRRNKGGPGGDGVTIERFGLDLKRNLELLSEQLQNGRYRPRPLRRVAIPKSDGGKRWLSIPAVVDRVAQSAALEALMPTLEPRMSEASWAYRPGRGVASAVAAVEAAYAEGYVWTVDADIACYFDRVPHRRLIDELTIWIDDDRVISLFGLWISGFGAVRGIAQGSPISPLLANLYLHPVDRLITAAGYPIVRYADNLVVMARSEAEARQAHVLLGDLLKSRGLTLNVAKTTIRGPEETFGFLGATVKAEAHG